MSKSAATEPPVYVRLCARGALLLGWIVPGLGHFVAGQRGRGIALGLLVGGTYIAGLALSRGEAVSRELHPYSFIAQIGLGVTLPILKLDPAQGVVKHGANSINQLDDVPRRLDSGLLFCNIAGLLNMLALFDLVSVLLRRDRSPAQ